LRPFAILLFQTSERRLRRPGAVARRRERQFAERLDSSPETVGDERRRTMLAATAELAPLGAIAELGNRPRNILSRRIFEIGSQRDHERPRRRAARAHRASSATPAAVEWARTRALHLGTSRAHDLRIWPPPRGHG